MISISIYRKFNNFPPKMQKCRAVSFVACIKIQFSVYRVQIPHLGAIREQINKQLVTAADNKNFI